MCVILMTFFVAVAWLATLACAAGVVALTAPAGTATPKVATRPIVPIATNLRARDTSVIALSEFVRILMRFLPICHSSYTHLKNWHLGTPFKYRGPKSLHRTIVRLQTSLITGLRLTGRTCDHSRRRLPHPSIRNNEIQSPEVTTTRDAIRDSASPLAPPVSARASQSCRSQFATPRRSLAELSTPILRRA